jgi:trehalose 6-phosphate phosphatase
VSPAERYEDPVAFAARVGSSARPVLLGLDVDGVLAPIVDHADDARLLDGASEAIGEIASRDGFHVAVVSGRALDDLERFAFHRGVTVVGSHGMESRRRPAAPLDGDERQRLDSLTVLAERAALLAGDGAWVESKPASVVVHVRTADRDLAARAIDELHVAILAVDGTTAKAGSGVLELFAREASKGTAIAALMVEVGAATTIFVGDDVTDEEAFAVLGDGDVGVKVGDAPTIAAVRLADPHAVLAMLRHLAHP